MKKPLKIIAMLSLSILLFVQGTLAADEPPLTLSGRISGCSGKSLVHIAVFDKTIFDGGKPIKSFTASPGDIENGSVIYRFELPPGSYTVSAYEDENANGKLDMGMFGPKEPSGFFRKFTAWRAPKFEDVNFDLKADMNTGHIKLK